MSRTSSNCCITSPSVGQVIFENETGAKETLSTGDYVHIKPMVKHWVIGLLDSQLLLVK